MRAFISSFSSVFRSFGRLILGGEELAEPELRRLLSFSAGAALTVLGSALSAILANAALRSSFQKESSRWVDAGSVSDLTDKPEPILINTPVEDGWMTRESRFLLYAYQPSAGSQPVILSPVCTHLGCTVRWESDLDLFRCPCHGGTFDKRGQVVSGPPQRPLAHLNYRVLDNRIQVEVI